MTIEDEKMIWEQYESPGRMSGGDIPFPDGRGEHDDAVDPNYRHPKLGEKGPRCGDCRFFGEENVDGVARCSKLKQNSHTWGVCDFHEKKNISAYGENDSNTTDSDFSDTIYRVNLYNGNSEMLLMNSEIQEDLSHMDGPKKGGATVWMGEEHMYLKPNKIK